MEKERGKERWRKENKRNEDSEWRGRVGERCEKEGSRGREWRKKLKKGEDQGKGKKYRDIFPFPFPC